MTTNAPFRLKLLTPDRSVIDQDVHAITIPGQEGEFTVLSLHAPIVAAMRQGVITVIIDNQATRSFSISGGFVDVNQTHCTILAENLEETSDEIQ